MPKLASTLLILIPALTSTAQAASPAPSSATHYVTIIHQVDVNRPAAAVWAKVGGYCDLAKWLGKSCDIVSGDKNEIGTTRRVGGQILEILVGRTQTSYTYAQPEMPGSPTHFYHGTLDVEPLTSTSSRIVYTLFYDNADVPTEQRAMELEQRSALFLKAVSNMKRIAEQR